MSNEPKWGWGPWITLTCGCGLRYGNGPQPTREMNTTGCRQGGDDSGHKVYEP